VEGVFNAATNMLSTLLEIVVLEIIAYHAAYRTESTTPYLYKAT